MTRLNDEQWSRLERAIQGLEQAWEYAGKAGPEPDFAQFLPCKPADPEYQEMLGRLVAADQECREEAGKPKTFEEYCRQWPLLRKYPVTDDGPATEAYARGIVSEKLGSCIGPYKLLGELGEGGFGMVYLAEQEKPIRRRVALKILKAGMDTRQVLARFEAERQALAMMDHPNIAKIFDAGVTESGRSYFVMELVHGEPITKYCDRHRLTLEERLELFIPVCQAVQHAHQKGIIHRDIKPSNVLVSIADDKSIAKIIDFGVAKATAQSLTQQTVFTELGQLIGTPEYMSPEQAEMSNLDIDTRSDVYSLGVLLYEMLTGALPFDRKALRKAGLDEIRRIIREEEPPKPSTKISSLGSDSQDFALKRQTDPHSLQRRLRQELDWIVMKTLEKDRTRRYGTATALAEDVQRYLVHEPVQAGPPGNWYRIRKYARRYRGPLAITAGFVAILFVTTIVAVRGYYREAKLRADAENARRQAEKNFTMSCEAVKKYYTRVADDPRLKPHNLEKLRRDLLQSANEFYEELTSQKADDADLQYERARAFLSRGDIEQALGNMSQAETAYNEVITVVTPLIRIYDNKPDYQNDLAASHNNLGTIYQATGRAAEAEAAYKEALAIRTTLTEKHPEVPDYQFRLAISHCNLGLLYNTTGRPKETETAWNEALAILRNLVERHPETSQYQDELATIYSNLGVLYKNTGRVKEAETAYKKAIPIQKRLMEKHPEDPEYHDGLPNSHDNLGNLYADTGRVKEAETAYKAALAIRKILAENHPEMPEYQNGLANSYSKLGILYMGTGRVKEVEAEAAYKAAIAIQKILVEKHPEVPEYQNGLGSSHSNLATFYKDIGRIKEAEEAYEAALAIYRILAEKHPESPEFQNNLAMNQNNLGNFYKDTSRVKEAEALYKVALAIRKLLAEKHPEMTEYQNNLAASHTSIGIICAGTGRAEEAEAAFREALAIHKTLAEAHPEALNYQEIVAKSHSNLGYLCQITGRAEEAEAAYKKAIVIQQTLAERYPEAADYQNDLAAFHNHLGILYRDTGRVNEAEAAFKEVIDIRRILARTHPDVFEYQDFVAQTQNTLGILYQNIGRADEADTVYKEALNIWTILAEKHPEVSEYQKRLVRRQKQDSLAEKYHGKKVAQNSIKASWSPDGGKLVVGKQPSGLGIQIIDLQTEKTTSMLDSGKDPAWSPGDGRWIAYVREDNPSNDEEVWIIDSSGNNSRKIAEGGFPLWSSDGKMLFFHSRKQQKIFVTNPNDEQALVAEVCKMPWSHYPTMSPKASQICYTNNDTIHILDRETKSETLSAPLPAEGFFLHSWSPDGKQIGLGNYSGNPEFTCGFWIFTLETKQFKEIASGPYAMPVWSPDGSNIAVDVRNGTCSEVWVLETKQIKEEK